MIRLIVHIWIMGLLDLLTTWDPIETSALLLVQAIGSRKIKTPEDDRNLIRYMMRHRHTSPFEMGEVVFHIKLPIFVMRQHIRHRTASVSEQSGRYSVLDDTMYSPPLDRFQGQSQTNKQQSGGSLSDEVKETCLDLIEQVYTISYEGYTACLNNGLAKEVSRIQLPLATYTEIYWKIDIHNLLHYLNLRTNAAHAQKEIVDLASTMESLVRPHFPFTFEAFDDYIRNAVTFSALEISELRQLLNKDSIDSLVLNDDLSNREKNEFMNKLHSIMDM